MLLPFASVCVCKAAGEKEKEAGWHYEPRHYAARHESFVFQKVIELCMQECQRPSSVYTPSLLLLLLRPILFSSSSATILPVTWKRGELPELPLLLLTTTTTAASAVTIIQAAVENPFLCVIISQFKHVTKNLKIF